MTELAAEPTTAGAAAHRGARAASGVGRINARRLLAGGAAAVIGFALLGTVAALWDNPLFVRMTPAGGWEIFLLAILALLGGVYVAIRRPFCSNGTATAGGVLGFLGVACPICNKILLLAFGSELLLTYYEPLRIYAAIAGVLVAAIAVANEWRQRQAALAAG